MNLESLTKPPHARFRGSVTWHLTPNGLSIDGAPPEATTGDPATVRRIWTDFGESIRYYGAASRVPVELIVATIATESGGNPEAVREEPGYVSDEETPNKVSPGLMQTLLSTAREATGNALIDRTYLLRPAGSIEAGTAYIARQEAKTGFDPPLVAAAYNAGGVYEEAREPNRWRLRCYPLGTGHHVDRWVKWFNDAVRLFRGIGPPAGSFTDMLT